MTRFTLITLNVLFVTALVLPAQDAALMLEGAPLVKGVYEAEAGAPVAVLAEFSDATLKFAIFACIATEDGDVDWSQAGILLDGDWSGNTAVLRTAVPEELAGLSLCLVAVALGVDGQTSASHELRIHVAAPYAPPHADRQAVTASYPNADLDAHGNADEEALDRKAPPAARRIRRDKDARR